MIIYEKLAQYLSPSIVPDVADDTDWTLLLQLANWHKCTPLWYVRLREKTLLEKLPGELVEYLAELHAANVERNRVLRGALDEIVAWFVDAAIELMLLKGAAVLADDLYGDPGARLMSDLDLLVPKEQAEAAQELLLAQGYAICPPTEEKIVYRLPTDANYHLEPLHRPGTGIVVEVHFKVMSRQSGRALPVEQVWQERVPAPGFPDHVFLPAPGWRLLHNALHALLPYGEFINARILLGDVAEAAALIAAAPEMQLHGWENAVGRHSLRDELGSYALLLRELMGVTLPDSMEPQTNRGLVQLLVTGGGRELQPVDSAMTARLRRHYLLRLPGYAWHNVCYAPGWWRLPERIGCVLSRGLRSSARKKMRF